MKNPFARNTKKLPSAAEHLHPTRDWLRLLSVIGVLFLMSIGYNLWQFSRVTAGEALRSGAARPPVANVSLETVDRVFETRSLERSKYQNEFRFVDPSR